jgi:hypothetical protein
MQTFEMKESVEGLEMVVIEEVLALREARKNGAELSAEIIAAGYLNPSCGGSQQLSPEEHTMGLACMVGVALYWLACQDEEK